MSSVNGVGPNQPVNKLAPTPVSKQIPADAPKQLRATDKVELSGVGHLLKSLKAGADFRADKVASIKAQIEAGAYEDDKKLDVAVDRMLDDLTR